MRHRAAPDALCGKARAGLNARAKACALRPKMARRSSIAISRAYPRSHYAVPGVQVVHKSR